MFLCFSMYRLSGSPIAVFDSILCSQHLQECLLKCLTCYEEIERINGSVYSTNNRIIVEAVYLMFYIDNPNVLQRAMQLNQKLKSSFIIQSAIKASLNFHLNNFYKVFRHIQELPHLVSATASLKLCQIRKEVLRVFSIAYNSSSLTVPIDFLKSLLIYDDMEILLRDLRNLGIQVLNGEPPLKVIFSRAKFDINQSIVSIIIIEALSLTRYSVLNYKLMFLLFFLFIFQSNTSHQFVEQKLSDYHLPDLILTKTV